MHKMTKFLVTVAALPILLITAVANAANAVPTAQASADGVIDVIATYGPVIGGMYLIYVTASSLVARYASSSWLAQGKRLAYTTGALGVAGAVLQAEIAGSSWTVVLAAAAAAAFKLLPPTVAGTVTEPTVRPAIVTLDSLLIVAGISTQLIVAGISTQLACTARTTAFAQDIWTNCLASERTEAVAVLTPLAESLILAAASADGKLIDAGKLKAATSKANLMTEAGIALECAMASAVTAFLTPQPTASGASALLLDPEALRDTWSKIVPSGAHFRTKFGDI
jgi:hypothetical protein